MLFRFFVLILWQLGVVVVLLVANEQFNFKLDPVVLSLVGAILVALGWIVLNLMNAARVLSWLSRLSLGENKTTPRIRGVWSEALNRMRRLLRKNEQDLALSENRLRDFLSAIQASPNGVILLDANGQIEWCNLTAAGHFGLNAKADVFQHIGNLVRNPLFASYFASGKYDREITIEGKSSSIHRPCRIALQIHPYGEGRKLMLSHDVTAVELSEMMRRDFVANVSHEIRTPLTVLSGFVETLQTLPLSDTEQKKYLDLMSQQAHRMQTLVSDLLILSKLEGSPNPLSDTWHSASLLTSSCEQEARALADVLHPASDESHQAQTLVFQVPANLEIAGSQAELISAMSNLVNNAVRYTPVNGSIQVVWHALPDGRAEFSVADTGLGIAPEHLPRLTERFYRVDTSRSRESGGTGLGLAIVKHVVQRHGGELRIDSTVGQGSTFGFTLPAHRVRSKSI